MARVANPGRGGLGDVAQYGVGADQRVAGLDLGVGGAATAAYVALARMPACGGQSVVESAGATRPLRAGL